MKYEKALKILFYGSLLIFIIELGAVIMSFLVSKVLGHITFIEAFKAYNVFVGFGIIGISTVFGLAHCIFQMQKK